ncbi:hypothetical protein BZA05DRAFT_408354 [Tricharina praecox]|uniref:uncharacterized protein n=1 Tax=Tricharina praecox TaxID=43433 RepID=UPI00221FC44E|nr:uncharacterized protein BZA05DRAFT_408354 [Tricharina praecox]KAI5845385.1 hypothetical protein BZA05DRAFT_408354 [Tricharina praecox]
MRQIFAPSRVLFVSTTTLHAAAPGKQAANGGLRSVSVGFHPAPSSSSHPALASCFAFSPAAGPPGRMIDWHS